MTDRYNVRGGGKVALLGYMGDLRCGGRGGGSFLRLLEWVCAGVAYTEGRGDASAQPLPVFGVVAVCPLEQGGVEAEVVWWMKSLVHCRLRMNNLYDLWRTREGDLVCHC